MGSVIGKNYDRRPSKGTGLSFGLPINYIVAEDFPNRFTPK